MSLVEPTRAFLADFGVSAVVGGLTVTAFYDAAYADALGMSGSRPALLLPLADAGAADQGTAVTAAALSYIVAERHDHPNDAPGWTRLLLERT